MYTGTLRTTLSVVAIVLLLLTVSAQPSTASVVGPLHEAVAHGDLADLKAALEAHPESLNSQGDGGQTPLMFACLLGKPAAVEFLLDNGAQLELGERDGYTCPHGAGFQGHASVVRVLARRGIDIDSPHSDGFRPVQRACWGSEGRHAAAVQAFVESGASPEGCQTRNQLTQKYLDEFEK
eukprot:PhM_4_TR5520/c0_g1_i1/m.48877